MNSEIVPFDLLRNQLEGDLYLDYPTLLMYATDASAYREEPLVVTRPKSPTDIKKIIGFAAEHKLPVIPRAAGTSLAGQVVGRGIVVDISKYFNKVLELNVKESWVRVQPGVVLDELNLYLKPHGLFFGPETSTSNRCMIGGMLGNNACGAHSLIYGSTRDHTLAVKGFLSDGSEVLFEAVSTDDFQKKCDLESREGSIYRHLRDTLNQSEIAEEIKKEYPDSRIKRRNTGYAIDVLLEQKPFNQNGPDFNLAKFVAGSEGTLLFATEITLNLVPLPPREKGLICAHFQTLEEAMAGNLIALKYHPGAIELIDKVILECTKENITQRRNRFFLQGDPEAVLVIEFARDSMQEIKEIHQSLVDELKRNNLGFHYPLLTGPDINKVWALRKSGLGLLSNVPGDAKPVSLIEDTAVHPENLPGYIADIKDMLARYKLDCVFHAHIATGELHLRPVLNLKDPADVELFRKVAFDTARLVKKYRGSLSGEHGDGRLRGEFIPFMIGERNYRLLEQLKKVWDPQNLFNPGKITSTPPMDQFLRYEPGKYLTEPETIFDFSENKGFIRSIEKCNGSGDCRKSVAIGGTMCPSYMATRDEKTTTRARANILREYISFSEKKNPFDHREVYDILDLCLSCKACKSECPSNVDMAKLKAEFLQHYYDANGISLRTRLIAYITWINRIGMVFPGIFNWAITNRLIAGSFKRMIGFAAERNIPTLHKQSLRSWAKKNLENFNILLPASAPTVNIFVDEFTDLNDTPIGIKAIQLLNRLGYRVQLPVHGESGRTYLSKGLIRTAKKRALRNVMALKDYVSETCPLVGIEPSAILAFRDEYPDLLRGTQKENARELAKHALMFEEFLAREIDKGNVRKELFTRESRNIRLHGHCQQKAVASTDPAIKVLSFPENFTVSEIPSGCCGMAGSFGYEKEHFDLSMQVGELVLFPEIRKTSADTIIAASGTSCRHQIKDGTGRKGLHPVEILFDALA
ncbi:MAG: FAD-binding and (Fe-S)-binding domain-containing protein [Bacteroidales bacterium]